MSLVGCNNHNIKKEQLSPSEKKIKGDDDLQKECGKKSEEYFKKEVLPHLPDAWIDDSKTKIGYEINFTKYFYKFKPLRSLEEI